MKMTILNYVLNEGRDTLSLGTIKISRKGEVIEIPILLLFDLRKRIVQQLLNTLREQESTKNVLVLRMIIDETAFIDITFQVLNKTIKFQSTYSVETIESTITLSKFTTHFILTIYSFTPDKSGYYKISTLMSIVSREHKWIEAIGKVDQVIEGDLENHIVRTVWPRESNWYNIKDVNRLLTWYIIRSAN